MNKTRLQIEERLNGMKKQWRSSKGFKPTDPITRKLGEFAPIALHMVTTAHGVDNADSICVEVLNKDTGEQVGVMLAIHLAAMPPDITGTVEALKAKLRKRANGAA